MSRPPKLASNAYGGAGAVRLPPRVNRSVNQHRLTVIADCDHVLTFRGSSVNHPESQSRRPWELMEKARILSCYPAKPGPDVVGEAWFGAVEQLRDHLIRELDCSEWSLKGLIDQVNSMLVKMRSVAPSGEKQAQGAHELDIYRGGEKLARQFRNCSKLAYLLALALRQRSMKGEDVRAALAAVNEIKQALSLVTVEAVDSQDPKKGSRCSWVEDAPSEQAAESAEPLQDQSPACLRIVDRLEEAIQVLSDIVSAEDSHQRENAARDDYASRLKRENPQFSERQIAVACNQYSAENQLGWVIFNTRELSSVRKAMAGRKKR